MNEKKEALRMEILKYIEKHSRVELGELAVLVGVEAVSYTHLRPAYRLRQLYERGIQKRVHDPESYAVKNLVSC